MKLYSSIVRSHMEYASQVWNPHLKKNIDELENTPKMALRICTRQWDLSYGDLLLNSKILTLAARREYLSLCTFYKIIHNHMFFPPNILHFKKPVSIRSNSCLKLVQPFARSNAFNHPSSHFCVLCGTTSPYILCRPQHFLSSRNYFLITCTQYMYNVYRYYVD